jgi:hypothetical protein
MPLQQSVDGESLLKAPIVQAEYSLTFSFFLLDKVGMWNNSLVSPAAFKAQAKDLLERTADFFHLVTTYCSVITIGKILHKMIAAWPCNYFTQEQTSGKASEVLARICPTCSRKINCLVPFDTDDMYEEEHIPSRWRSQVPGWSALDVVLFHFCIRSGYVTIQQPTIQQPMMYLPEQAQPLTEK